MDAPSIFVLLLRMCLGWKIEGKSCSRSDYPIVHIWSRYTGTTPSPSSSPASKFYRRCNFKQTCPPTEDFNILVEGDYCAQQHVSHVRPKVVLLRSNGNEPFFRIEHSIIIGEVTNESLVHKCFRNRTFALHPRKASFRRELTTHHPFVSYQ
eukprot:PhF_6_TR1189/c0_g1_i1/m.2335